MVSVATYLLAITSTHPDTVPAHWLAYSIAKILHSDVSVQNIMIDEEGNGMLTDWDFSEPVGPGERRRGWRTVSTLNSYHLIIPTCLTGNLAVHLRRSFNEARCHPFL